MGNDDLAYLPLKPEGELVINTPEMLKVIADPVRLRIVDLLTRTPLTVKQVGNELGIALSKMYYHINLLEEHGFIRIISTRLVSNLVEKLYQATAYSYNVDKSLLTFSNGEASSGDVLMSTMFDMVKSEVKHSVEVGLIDNAADAPLHRSLRFSMAETRLHPTQAAAFYTRFKALTDEFEQAKAADDDSAADNYALLTVIFPTASQPSTAADVVDEV